MQIGVAYYPEHWPEEKWAEDFRLMKEANISLVRMGDFAWCRLEPKEDCFDFEWLERAINLAAEVGLKVILATPTAGIPSWLAQKYPEIFKVDENGRSRIFGGRSDYCINQSIFRARVKRIVQALALHFGKKDAVIGWQIDNEPGWNGFQCYCEECNKKFREWLKSKYGSLKDVNKSWGTIFGGQEYSNWEQIRLLPPKPLHNPALLLDSYRFFVDSYIDYIKFQSEILREFSQNKFITTNITPLDIDGPKFAEPLDFISFDCYPTLYAPGKPFSISFFLDRIRNYENNFFFIMEQQAGIPGDIISLPSPRPGQIRLWTYQSFAHGAEGVVYFRWRTCPFGAEQFWQGILDYSGYRSWRYNEVRQTGEEVRRISKYVDDTVVHSEVAIIYSHETAWAFSFQPHLPDFNYVEYLQSFHKILYNLGFPCDIIFPCQDFSQYRLLLAPTLWLVNDTTIERLRDYVSKGGTLIATLRTAVKDSNNNVRSAFPPAGLNDVFGIIITEYKPLEKTSDIKVTFVEEDKKRKYPTKSCIEKIEPKGATTVSATYYAPNDSLFDGYPAVTQHIFGKGKAVYVGTITNDDFTKALLQRLTRILGLKPIAKPPEDIEVVRRVKEDFELIFILNHSSVEKEITMRGDAELLRGCNMTQPLVIEPYGIRIVMRKR